MQQVGELILKDYLSTFETIVNRKDLVIKTLVLEVEKKDKELKEIKEVVKKLGLFLEGLGE